MKPSLIAAVGSLSVMLVSCTGGDSKEPVEFVTYPLKGEIVRIDTSKSRLMIAHQEIPGFMAAMTMSFNVKDTAVLGPLSVGDSVVATLVVARHESWLEGIQRAGRGPFRPKSPKEISATRQFKDGETILGPAFTDQDYRPFSLTTLRGRVVAINFFYTLCPLPDFCLRMTNSLARAQELLKKDRRLVDRWHLVSVSFDPNRDTPPVLKAYGSSHGVDWTTWTIATAPQNAVREFAEGFGLTFDDGDNGMINHNLRTVVLDRDGRLIKTFTGNDWNPEELVRAIKDAL